MKNNKKTVIVTLVAIISLIVITVGVTYAFFNYAKIGTTDNTIKTGTITFLYTEVSGVGKGISLTEAYPVTDSIGKVQVGEGTRLWNPYGFTETDRICYLPLSVLPLQY